MTLANDFNMAASAVDDTEVSTTKWRGVGGVLAETLGYNDDDIYVTTVSKPGNVTVRMGQSPKARGADLIVMMYTGHAAQLPQAVDTAARRAADDGNGQGVLFYSPTGGGW